jgi:hypothetical protein
LIFFNGKSNWRMTSNDKVDRPALGKFWQGAETRLKNNQTFKLRDGGASKVERSAALEN